MAVQKHFTSPLRTFHGLLFDPMAFNLAYISQHYMSKAHLQLLSQFEHFHAVFFSLLGGLKSFDWCNHFGV